MISVVDIHDQRSFRGPSELDNFSDGRFVSAVESVKQHGRSANIIVAPQRRLGALPQWESWPPNYPWLSGKQQARPKSHKYVLHMIMCYNHLVILQWRSCHGRNR